jgi:ubiquinone/menaquinone biosynthesis C-methylase UbiE
MGEAAERWRGLVEGRLAEMERLQAGRGDVGGKFWDRRAGRAAKGPAATAGRDPMLSRLRREVGRSGRATVLYVGSGPCRFALAIAPRVQQVTAVDPSAKMLALLRRRAREAGIGNVRTVAGTWQEAEVEGADVVLCSHVVTLVSDVVPFVRKLDGAARRRVLLYVGGYAADGVLDPFWRRFHGQPRRPGASWVDALAVLEEEGLDVAVEVVELPTWSRHETLADAVEVYRDQLVLPRTREVRAELARLLEPWLQRRDGYLTAPFRTQPAAILSWAPSHSS